MARYRNTVTGIVVSTERVLGHGWTLVEEPKSEKPAPKRAPRKPAK